MPSENIIFSGPYLVGDRISLLDCSFAPKLYHMDAALAHFYPDTLKKVRDFKNLRKYQDTMFSHPAFKSTKYPSETVVWGWTGAREAAAKAEGGGCGV